MLKKLGKKKIIILALVFVGVIAVCIFLFGKKQETTKQAEEEISLKQGQSLVYGQIASVYGNEISYYVKEELIKEEVEVSDEKEKEETQEEKASQEPKEKTKESDRPQWGKSGDTQAPEEEKQGSDRPQWGEGDRPQMPGRESSELLEEERMQEDTMVLTDEKVTVQIPVGTKVTTRLGTETTFSRLAAGDNIKMLMQEKDGEQVILEIWIVD